ncbi:MULTISPECIES: hypothetical protein [Chryseobacterium]|uniref:Uncharacterized protein n=1 Tax=Chryseobacterium kwangjuense TaxID=267125 RepID=A0A135WH01_9FLAO|nr:MULTISPECIES: hypothetical protein [Chryseobacterium]KXH84188.1 hypothetical protein AU378_00015 [Chryseobacterium kwangjuense]
MITIRKKNNIFLTLIFLIFFFQCTTSKGQKNNPSKQCVLFVTDKAIKLNVNDSILKEQVEDYYKNIDNKYDIIFYRIRPGDKNITLRRIYKNIENKWIYIEIFNNNIISKKELKIDDSILDDLFTDFSEKGMLKKCGSCYDCYDYMSLIKKDNKYFSLNFNSLSNELNNSDLIKLKPYMEILNFFNQYSLSFIK